MPGKKTKQTKEQQPIDTEKDKQLEKEKEKEKEMEKELVNRIEIMEKQVELLMSNLNELNDDSYVTTKNATKKSKDDKPKRKPSGYNLFCKAMRDDAKELVITEQDLDEGKKPSNQDVMAKLGNMWKELSDKDKQEWIDKAKADEVEVEVEVE